MSDTLRVLYDRKNEVFRLRLCSVDPVKNNTFKTVEECIGYLEGHTTLTEDDLKLFDGSDGQGIRCNKNSPIIILISGHRDYTDDDDGEILKYQGMKNNNSQNRSKNKQIVDTLDDHRPLCVLESFMDRDGKKMYAYKGQYILIEEPNDWPTYRRRNQTVGTHKYGKSCPMDSFCFSQYTVTGKQHKFT